MAALRVFNIERFGTEDGPGIRTVVFLKGCLLRCRWCANPESQSFSPEILLKENACVQCGKCEAICPNCAISRREQYGFLTDRKMCNLCLTCVEECPCCARELMGREYEISGLLEEVLRDREYFLKSAGGVTFSGGEPLLQADGVAEAAGALRRQKITTYIETCGEAPLENLKTVAREAAGFFYDIKEMDSRKHKQLTGRSNVRILENLDWLLEHFDGEITVRYPYIPGCNDALSDIEAFLRFAVGRGLCRVVFLPYHRLGIDKYRGLGRRYAMGEMPSLKKSDLEFLKEIAASYGVEAVVQ